MKKLVSVSVILMFMFSMLPLAFGEQVQPENKLRATALSTQADGIREKTGNINNFEECVRKARKKFPNANKEKIAKECREIAGIRQKIQTGAKKRPYIAEKLLKAIPEARLRALDRLADKEPKVKRFLSSLSEEIGRASCRERV